MTALNPAAVVVVNDEARDDGQDMAVPRSQDDHGIDPMRNAVDPDSWPEPLALPSRTSEREPYPLDALPEYLSEAVGEVHDYVQAPVPMIATGAIAAMAVAAQAHVDVARDDRLVGPVSVFALILGESGERKTTCEAYFTAPIEEYETEQRIAAAPLLRERQAQVDVYSAKRSGLLAEITRLSKDGKPTEAKESALAALDEDKPVRERVPSLLVNDPTTEGVLYELARTWPSAAIVSDEGGSVLGGHAMGREAIMRNLAALNTLWGGGTHRVVRRTSESFTVEGARLSMSIMVQGPTLAAFLEKNGALARGSGFLARFLICDPESTQGRRPYREPPTHWPGLDRFHNRMREVLREPAPVTEHGRLEPRVITLDEGARRAWRRFHDAVESGLGAGGPLVDVRDVASKAADNAARVAALFALFDIGAHANRVETEHMESACRIVAWHLAEARRLFGELTVDTGVRDAENLEAWLVARCHERGVVEITRRDVQRYGPGATRKGERLRAALDLLGDHERVRLATDDRSAVTVRMNPALLGGARS